MSRPAVVISLLVMLQAHAGKNAPMSHRLPLPSPATIATLPPDGGAEFNRLVFSNSPYLLQHARNPVDWFPWGDEAFAKARSENKPVFLSVGYSSCHWCHVMEHESFEDEGIAALLNEHFVCIKVDREERPDVDAVYMHATQLFTGRGGWPNSVFLTTERLPFFAGTYWPKNDRGGHPGFRSILQELVRAWREQPDQIQAHSRQVADALQRMAYERDATQSPAPSTDLAEQLLHELEARFDPRRGGFGGAPKFPPHSSLAFLLYEQSMRPNSLQEDMIRTTLDQMALGGIHDHVGGGFHRYATDGIWFLPHFEKMLYDNGQLARSYALAYQQFRDPLYARALRRLCDWVLRQMHSAEGGFFSALDADSEGEEGLYYIWTHEELTTLLGPDAAEALATAYEATGDGNYFEEATGAATGANILHLRERPDRFPPELDASLDALRDHREAKRVPPQLDDKIIASWNGLMIGGLATAGQVLDHPPYLDAARKAAEAILQHQRTPDGRLFRVRRAERSHLDPVIDDYAFLAAGLLDLHGATGEERWREEARALMNVLEQDFADGTGGYYFSAAAGAGELPVRHRDPIDNATPSGLGIAAQVWVRLGDADRAGELLQAFAPLIQAAPRACESLLVASQMLNDRREAASPDTVWCRELDAFRLCAPTVELQPGRNRVELALSIRAGWHLNANPASQEGLIPTELRLLGSGGRMLKINYPAGTPFKTAAFPGPVQVYSGDLDLTVELEVDPKARDLAIELVTQACNDQSCQAVQRTRIPLVFTGSDTGF